MSIRSSNTSRVVPEELSHSLHQKYKANGIDILSNTTPCSLHGDGVVTSAILDNGQSLETSLVVMGVGIELDTDLARKAGLDLWEQDAVQVDEMLRTSDPDIYAAGDIAAWPDPTFGRLRVEHWDVAWNQGMQALVKAKIPYQTALKTLRDEHADLSTLIDEP